MFNSFGWHDVVRWAPYEFKRSLLNIDSLENRRKNASIFFMFDLINGYINAPILLAKINFNVPARPLRCADVLRPHAHRTNYGQAEPVSRMSAIVNSTIGFDFDIGRYRSLSV